MNTPVHISWYKHTEFSGVEQLGHKVCVCVLKLQPKRFPVVVPTHTTTGQVGKFLLHYILCVPWAVHYTAKIICGYSLGARIKVSEQSQFVFAFVWHKGTRPDQDYWKLQAFGPFRQYEFGQHICLKVTLWYNLLSGFPLPPAILSANAIFQQSARGEKGLLFIFLGPSLI